MRTLHACIPLLFVGSALAVAAESSAPATAPVTLASVGLNPSWMDKSVDPCTDFYAYSCGGFDKNEPIPADRASWGATEQLEKSNEDLLHEILEQDAKDAHDPVAKKIGDWYSACMNEDAIEKRGATPLAPLLAEVAKVKDAATLDAAVAVLHQHQIWVLFDIGAVQDFKDATQEIAMLDQDGLGLPDRDYYVLDDGNRKEVRDLYRAHVERVMKLIGEPDAEAKQAVEDVMRIETKIAKLSQTNVARRDPNAIYHRVERAGLAAAAKTFPWDAYFAGLGFPDLKTISVNSTDYFKGIDDLTHAETPEAWRHYLAFHVADDEAMRLSKAFVDEAFAMRKALTGEQELPPRWKRCVRSTDGALGELLGQAYVAQKFNGDSKTEAERELTLVKGAMHDELAKLAWMDPATRDAAQAKLAKITDKVGYPARWKSYDYAVSRDDYATNAMASDAFELQRNLKKIGKPIDHELWDMTPPTVNAYYDPSMNQINFPAGILQPPFFSKDFAEAVNFGATVGAMGHELTHGFDDEGSQFDGDGNLRDWWTPATEKKFKAQTGCVSKQYSRYSPLPGVHLNGDLTLGENIADIGGLKLALSALHASHAAAKSAPVSANGFTEDQIFFLAYGQSWCEKQRPELVQTLVKTDPHSPARFRVNGPVSDVPAFGQAFKCKKNAPLMPPPAQVCDVW